MPRDSQLYTRWALEMRRSGFFHAGQRVGVAVSGGADSVLLFDFMRRLARSTGLTLSLLHFNHRLRGAESDADEQFVRRLAESSGVEVLVASTGTRAAARRLGANLEATARRQRYLFFFSLARQGRFDKVATAHTASDQAETVLLRLLRGTGSRGLGGIYPVLDGVVVRPFLSLTRDEVRAEVAARGLEFRTDSSNLDPKLARNKVRGELLPFLAREFNPRIVPALSSLAARARDEEAYLEQQAHDRARPWRVRSGAEEKMPASPLAGLPPAIARRVLRQMIEAARGDLKRLTHEHVEALWRLVSEGQSGRRLALPGAVARLEFDWLVIGPEVVVPKSSGYSYPVEAPGVVRMPELGVQYRFKIVAAGVARKSYNTPGSVEVDARKAGAGLVLRNWRPGDRFQPRGTQRPLKLKELFGRRRIPPADRPRWPVLENSSGIIWARGFPPAASVGVDGSTSEILEIVEEASA
ncbi:MAG TPA: tRNA lysidine(34) synthetase TilS [Terriglobia bacterium]|nr:tRNA lysidine(34) synthetase TilS [Terriglobia bacterium]